MNKKEKIFEIICFICIFYTAISIVNASLALFKHQSTVSAFNQIDILIWTTIGTTIIYTHCLFDQWSPLFMILFQYILAQSLIFLTIYLSGLFVELHPRAYIDGFRSFTIPYIIGAIIYYTHLFREAKRQNALLQEVKKSS